MFIEVRKNIISVKKKNRCHQRRNVLKIQKALGNEKDTVTVKTH